MDEDIVVTLKRSNDLLMTFGNDYSDVFLPAIDEIELFRTKQKIAVEQISKLQAQLKVLQDDEMQNAKTIHNLSKMAARFRKGLDRIYDLHNSGDEYSEREINDKTYEIVVTAIAGTLYDKGPRLDDRGDNLDGN